MKLRTCLLILFCLMSFSPSWAQEEAASEQSDQFNLIGAAAIISTSPYKDDDMKFAAVPIGLWRDKHFFIEGFKGGWIFAENEDLRADLFLMPRLMGYDADDADSLSGMDNRDFSIDGGIQLKWVIQQVEGLSLNLGATTDLLSKHEGQEVTLAGKKVFKGKIYQIIPEAGVKWQSSNMVDYYYGVRDPEVASGRPAYEPDSAMDPFVASRFYLGLSENWILISRVGYEFLGEEIQDSPIVDKEGIFSMLIGIARRF